MFYHIEGTVAEFGQNLVVIDCNGLGFALNTTVNTQSALRIGEKARLYVAESIGETNFDLFGFATKNEKRCFELLVSVSGIGPKAALSILSYNTPESLTLAVLNDDVKALTVAPGIGKKIAQRVVMELKDRLGKELGPIDAGFSAAVIQPAADGALGDALAALSVLGYSSAEVAPVIKTLDTGSLTTEQIIKAVLKQMVR